LWPTACAAVSAFLCAQRPEILKRLLHDLIFLGLNPDHERERGALDLLETDAYFPQKHFEPLAMMDLLIRSIDKAHAGGFTSFRRQENCRGLC
jgi:hypothetical protein